MKPRSRNLSLVFAAAMPLTFGGLTLAATVTYDATTTTTAAQDGVGAGWNTTNVNFWNGTADVAWPNTTSDEAIFGAGSGAGAAGSVTVTTVNANKITFNTPGSGNYTLTGGTITLGGSTPTIAANANATIGSVLAGSAGLTKAGTGTLTLTGGNTYIGGTVLSAGQLNINNAVALGGAASTLTINGGTLDNTTGGALSLTNNYAQNWNGDFTFTGTQNLSLGTGAVAMSASRTVTVNANMLTVGGVISGGGLSLTKAGAGILTLSGTNTYSGGTSVNVGALSLLNTNAKTGTFAIAAGATLGLGVAGANAFTAGDIDSLFTNTLANVTMDATSLVGIDTTNGDFTYATSASGTRGLNKLGTGTLLLTGTNSYTGITTISAGTVRFPTTGTLYNSTPASWTAANFSVLSGATALFNVGGAGEFTTAHIDTLRALGTATGGFRNNSTLGLDTTNASGGVFTYTAITNPNANANVLSLVKFGTGTLELTGASTYTGSTTINGGEVTFSGTAASTGGGNVNIATLSGSRAVLNMNSSGIVSATASAPSIGGNGGATDTGAGALNQTSGTLNLTSGGSNYLTFGNNSGTAGTAYGSCNLSGGTLNITTNSGLRLGYGGMGSWVQSNGTFNCGRWLVIGGGTTSGKGVATFTGGSVTVNSSYRINLSDNAAANGTLNLGTAAGGNATITALNTSGPNAMAVANGTTAINLNSGTFLLGGPIIKANAGTTALNLNGGTLKANGSVSLITGGTGTTQLTANVYNGGLKVDTQANSATISANLLATIGNGIYPAGGTISVPGSGGSGYIGAPLVTVASVTGTGTGASAIANVVGGVVTGVTLTCPGQGYAAGDQVSFAFAGGGPLTAATTYTHTLTAANLAANGTGGLTKLGTGTLTLSGANTFTGSVSVDGTLVTNNLALSNATLTVNNFALGGSNVPVQVLTTFTTSGTVPVQVNGTFSAGNWPVIYYPSGGSIGGAGIGALQLQTGSLPRGVVATLVDNPGNSSVDLNVTDFNPLTWKGTTNAVWDVNTTANWKIGATTEKYLENDLALFNDTATGSTSVTLNTTVSPQGVTFDNSSKSYTLSGSGAIGGSGGVSKTNGGTVTLLTANTYTGTTTVDGGVLQLGNGTVSGSITGPLVNNANVTFNPAGSQSYSGTISGSGEFITKAGTGTLTLTGSNTFSGTYQINQGTLQFGNGSANTALGTGAYYEIATGALLRLDQASVATPPWASISGAGIFALNSAVSGDWGNLALSSTYTGTLRVEEGRVNANTGSAALGSATKIEILPGAQFLAFESGDPYTTPIEIAGTGWGETGYPGGLRLAADRTAIWAGRVTLTADSGIMAQRNTNFTIAGSITGAHLCEFYAGDPAGDSGTLTVAPAALVQNSYASTRINGRPNGSIVAGNPYAFSTGPLEVTGAILKLNGNSFSFANLGGTGGRIGNYHATTPSVLTVGADNSSTTYAGVIVDGGAAPLAVVKAGSGTLTLTGTNAYTGDTTVSQGVLSLGTPSLGDASTVTIASGAKLDLATGTALDTVGKLILGGVNVPPGTYNSSHPTYGTFFTGTGSVVVAGAGFSSWATSKGLDATNNGLTQDPDNDGTSNLMEFYLNGNPLAADSPILPVRTLDATYLTLTFSRRDDAEADVTTQAVQYGTTLAGWTDVPVGAVSAPADANGVIVSVAENTTDPDTITVQIPRALAPGGKLFGRLKVAK